MRPALILAGGLILIAPLFSVQAENAPLDEAESLFASRCVMCHQLPEPEMLKPKQWRLIIGTMQQRMKQANVPPLQAQEREMILDYLTARARQ